MISLVCH